MTTPTDSRGRLAMTAAVALFAGAFIYFLRYALAGLPWAQDEGVEVAAATQILAGRHLFSEIVQSDRIAVYLVAGLYKVFGARLVVTRVFEALVCAGFVVAVGRFTAARAGALLGAAAAICTATWAFPFWNLLGWDWEGLLLLCAAAALTRRHLTHGALTSLAGAGACIGAYFFLQPDGAGFAGASLAVFLVARRAPDRSAGWVRALVFEELALAGGFAAVCAAVAAAAAGGGFLRAMLRQDFIGPLTTFKFVEKLTIPYPLPPFRVPPEQWWYGANFETWSIYLYPLLALPLGTALVAMRFIRRDPRAADELLMLVVCTDMFILVFPRCDIYHFIFGLPGVFALVAYAVSRALERARAPGAPLRGAAWAAAGALALSMGVAAVNGHLHSSAVFSRGLVRSEFPFLSGVRIEKEREDQFRALRGFLDANGVEKGAGVLILPADPILYPILDLTNPTRYNGFDPGHHDIDDEREIVGALQAGRGDWIIFKGWDEPAAFAKDAPMFFQHVATRYMRVFTAGPYSVLRRIGATP